MSEPKAVILAQFGGPEELIQAAKKTREAGYKKFDCHSPYPIHGMDQAMGLKRSPLGYIIGIMGGIGLVSALGLQYWTSAVEYPLIISGKPFFSYQAFIPVTFAITVLFAAFGAFFGMLHLNRLPKLFDIRFNSETFGKVSDGGFFVSVESTDSKFDQSETTAFLQSIGASEVEFVEDKA